MDHRRGYREQWRTESVKRPCSIHEWLFRTSGGWLHLWEGAWVGVHRDAHQISALVCTTFPEENSLSFKHFRYKEHSTRNIKCKIVQVQINDIFDSNILLYIHIHMINIV